MQLKDLDLHSYENRRIIFILSSVDCFLSAIMELKVNLFVFGLICVVIDVTNAGPIADSQQATDETVTTHPAPTAEEESVITELKKMNDTKMQDKYDVERAFLNGVNILTDDVFCKLLERHTGAHFRFALFLEIIFIFRVTTGKISKN